MTTEEQKEIVKKALGYTEGLFIAVITKTPHPKDNTEVEYEGKTYWVTLTYGDFASIYLN